MSALPAGWSERAPTFRDVDLAVRFMNERSQKLYGDNQVTREVVEVWWKSPRLDLARDVRLVFDARGELAAMANIGNPGEPYAEIACGAVAHPAHEDDSGVWDWLHVWVLERAQDLVPLAPRGIRVAAHAMIASGDSARRAALERAGFKAVRVANHMRIDLVSEIPHACWPDGVRVRAADVEADLPSLVALYLDAWRDHWGFVEEPLDQVLATWRQGIEADGDRFDPSLWFLAVEGKEVVGISLCNAHIAGDATRGYVQALGVRPAWRKRGVALALLHHTFAEFRRRGYAAVELDMDSQNLTGALRVYERAGMRAVRQAVSYEKELRPGIDLATRELAA